MNEKTHTLKKFQSPQDQTCKILGVAQKLWNCQKFFLKTALFIIRLQIVPEKNP